MSALDDLPTQAAMQKVGNYIDATLNGDKQGGQRTVAWVLVACPAENLNVYHHLSNCEDVSSALMLHKVLEGLDARTAHEEDGLLYDGQHRVIGVKFDLSGKHK